MQIFQPFPSAGCLIPQANPFLWRLKLLELVGSGDLERAEAMQQDLLMFRDDLDHKRERLHLHLLNRQVRGFCIFIALLCPTAAADRSSREG